MDYWSFPTASDPYGRAMDLKNDVVNITWSLTLKEHIKREPVHPRTKALSGSHLPWIYTID